MSKSREEKKRKRRELLERRREPTPMFEEGRIPPLAELPPHLTLNEVYGWKPCTEKERWSGTSTRVCELRETPFEYIEEEDICFLLRQKVGVELFVEQALAWLEQ